MKQHSTFTTTTSSQTGFSIKEMEKAIEKLSAISTLHNKLILVSKKHYRELDKQMRKHPANKFSFEVDDFVMAFTSCRIMVKPYLKKMKVIDLNLPKFYHSNPVLDL